jgi:chorismate-pyruvate lyase
MAQQTAMQELIEWMEKDLENGKKTIGNILEKSNKLLEKEKEQIINAHTNAYLIGEDNISVEDANKASEQYYNQTYNQNQ